MSYVKQIEWIAVAQRIAAVAAAGALLLWEKVAGGDAQFRAGF